MRFVLFVEGQTEQRAVTSFLKRWLDPRLTSPIAIKVIRYAGLGDLLKDVAKGTKTVLNDPRDGREVIAVISLLDFYGSSFSYPKDIESTDSCCKWAKQYIESLSVTKISATSSPYMNLKHGYLVSPKSSPQI